MREKQLGNFTTMGAAALMRQGRRLDGFLERKMISVRRPASIWIRARIEQPSNSNRIIVDDGFVERKWLFAGSRIAGIWRRYHRARGGEWRRRRSCLTR